MKKSYFIFLFMTLIAGTTFAQGTTYAVGIEGGVGLRTLRYNEVIDKYNKTILGYSGAIFFDCNFNEVLSLHTSVGYEMKGTKTKAAIVDGNGNLLELADANRNLSYLCLPVLLRVTFTQKIKIFVNAGPYFAYLLKEKAKIETSDGPWDLDYTDHDKKFDGGVCYGIGGTIPLNSRFGFTTEIRGNFGLSNISKDKSVDGNVKNNSINFLFGLVYNLSDNSESDDSD